MSKILSDTYEVIEVKKKYNVKGVECDDCKKMVYPAEDPRQYDNSRYFVVTTGHHEWGNDSIDSVEQYDICPGCITGFVDRYFKNGRQSSYMDIETRHVPKYEYE